MPEFNTELTQQHIAMIIQYGAAKKVGCKCTCSCKGYQLLIHGRQTKQLKMLVTVLPNVTNEQLLFVTLDFKICKRFNG